MWRQACFLGWQPPSPSQEKNHKNWVKVITIEVFFASCFSYNSDSRKGKMTRKHNVI